MLRTGRYNGSREEVVHSWKFCILTYDGKDYRTARSKTEGRESMKEGGGS